LLTACLLSRTFLLQTQVVRVDGRTVIPDFKMQVRAGAFAGGTHVANELAGGNLHAAALHHASVHQMGVKREITVAVVNDDGVAITAG